MNNFMQRGDRMQGSSKLYGSIRPQDDWKSFSGNPTPNALQQNPQMQGTSRQHESTRMPSSRFFTESAMYDAGGATENTRPYGGSHPPREVRTVRVQQSSRMEMGNRFQEGSRGYDRPPQDAKTQMLSAVPHDYHHRHMDDLAPFPEPQPRYTNTQRKYNVEGNADGRQRFVGTGRPNSPANSFSRNRDPVSSRNYHEIAPTPGHHPTPNPGFNLQGQSRDGNRPLEIRNLITKEKNSKAFEYLKNWRLKMNMPTDSFLLEKEVVAGDPPQADVPMESRDDWYTQPPTSEPRRASIGLDWNRSDNSLVHKQPYKGLVDRFANTTRYNPYGESSVGPKRQSIENNWAEKNQSPKRNYENIAPEQSMNQPYRDVRFTHDSVPSKRPRMSPPSMQNVTHNLVSNEPQSQWVPPFHGHPIMDSSNLPRSFNVENGGGNFRDVPFPLGKNIERSPPQSLGRAEFIDPPPQASRYLGQRAPRELDDMDRGRPKPDEILMSSGPYSRDMSPQPHHGIRSHTQRSPGRGARGKSPNLSPRKSSSAKGKSPGPGRDRGSRPGRMRSPGPARFESDRRRSSVGSGRQHLAGTAEVRDGPRRGERSSGAVRGRSSPPPRRSPNRGRLRSPGRLANHSERRRSPFRRGKSPGSLGRGSSPSLSSKSRPQMERLNRPEGGLLSGSLERARTSSRTGAPDASGKATQSSGITGKGRQNDAVRKSPRQRNTNKPSTAAMRRPAEHPRSLSPATRRNMEREVGRFEDSSSSSRFPRGRSPVRRSPGATRVRSGSFFDEQERHIGDRLPGNRSRSPRSPRDHMTRGYPEENEAMFGADYRDYQMDDGPAYCEDPLPPRSGGYSPTMDARARHRRERSLSVDFLTRGRSPVPLLQAEDHPHQDAFQRNRRDFRSRSPHPDDGYVSGRRNEPEVRSRRYGRQQEREGYHSGEVFPGRGGQSIEREHNTEDIWRKDRDRGGGQRNSSRGSSAGRVLDRDRRSAVSTNFLESPEGFMEGADDDDDLRIHLLRLREHKVEMKLIQLEEESKETEIKLLELKANKSASRERNPSQADVHHPEEDPFVGSHGGRREDYPQGHRRSTSPHQERHYRQHSRL